MQNILQIFSFPRIQFMIYLMFDEMIISDKFSVCNADIFYGLSYHDTCFISKFIWYISAVIRSSTLSNVLLVPGIIITRMINGRCWFKILVDMIYEWILWSVIYNIFIISIRIFTFKALILLWNNTSYTIISR